eukprot:TRINITY_DN31862_c0_g1_i1.p1 TRINITY_DN31862_c0_g1~~TRINITY_DN31862_c0_g1_i1.p1  ORF type:complete len:720 (-),score=113.93 TRINITY_DN31862_c0_g1_i1:85-2214(-)
MSSLVRRRHGMPQQSRRRRHFSVALLSATSAGALLVLGSHSGLADFSGFVPGPRTDSSGGLGLGATRIQKIKAWERRARDRLDQDDSGGNQPGAEEKESWFRRFGTQFGVLLLVGLASTVIVFNGRSAIESQINGPQGPSSKDIEQRVFEQWYARAAEASKKATKVAQRAQEVMANQFSQKGKGDTRLLEGIGRAGSVKTTVVERLRELSHVLDQCQEDIYDEFWDGLNTYPPVLRAHIPLFTYYTEQAFPDQTRGSAQESLRFALKYEVGRYARALVSFEDGVEKRQIREVERAFADMSLAYDRYLKAGNLYAGYDPVTSTTVFYEGIDDKQLVYTPLSLEQPRIRDEVLVIQGPDKGKVGKVIWLGRNGEKDKDPGQISTATVKLSPNPLLSGNVGAGIREVKAYPYSWIAVTRTTQESFLLDLVLGGIAAIFSCAITYPLDSMKARIQSKQSILPPEGVGGLFNGLTFNLFREVPNQAMYLAGFNLLTRQFCLLPFVDANNPSLKLLVMVPAGVLGFLSGSFFRAPFELLNRQMQTGQAKTEEEAIQQSIFDPPQEEVIKSLSKSWVLCVFKGVPFGALQCTFYELFKDRLDLVQYGVPISAMPFIWGALAGGLTAVITNPPDYILTCVSRKEQEMRLAIKDGKQTEEEGILQEIWKVTVEISQEDGPAGFFRGAGARAVYFAPEACLWFAAYEYLRSVADLFSDI